MTRPQVESLWELKHCRALRSVGQLRVIDLTKIKRRGWSCAEASTDWVIFKVKHRGPSRRVLIKDLLHQKQNSSLLGRLEMQLQQGEPFYKSIDHFDWCLPSFAEHNVHAFKKGLEVFGFKRSRPWLFKHPLDDSVESIYEVFLVHFKRGGSSFEDLESAKQTSENIANIWDCLALVVIRINLDFEILAHYRK